MRSAIVFALFFCALLAFAAADTERYKDKGSSSTQNVVLDLDGDCNYKYIAVEIENAKVGIRSVEIKDYRAKSWSTMTYNSAKDEYEINYQTRINFPISFQVTSVAGETIIATDAYRTLRGYDKFDTGRQFTKGTTASTPSATEEDVTVAPDARRATTTRAPKATTTRAPKATTTRAPKATTTAAPKAPTTTRAPVAGTTKAPVANNNNIGVTGCSAPMKLMVPLYTYPGATWDTVIAASRATATPTVAIINPNSGPGSGPDSAFRTYTKKMYDAGVEMVGYVHTSYGARSIATVKAEINVYAQEFQYVSGIFLDEASASAAQLAYYQELHDYIMSLPGFKYNIINPGAVPAQGYLNAATQIVSFESSASSFASSSNPSFASCANKDKFVAISYGASSASTMQSFLTTAKSKGYYGWAYVNDGSLSGGTYNRIPSYYAQQAAYMAAL